VRSLLLSRKGNWGFSLAIFALASALGLVLFVNTGVNGQTSPAGTADAMANP
jgi:hypothetical protein